MAYSLEDKLVIAVASSALFDLSVPHEVFRKSGLEAYRLFQRSHEDQALPPGVAFPFIRRLLSVNGPAEDDKPVEVILLSKNDPDTGLRVFGSIEAHGLDITRAAFLSGRPPYRYMPAFNCALFLSSNEKDVDDAIRSGYAAGMVMNSKYTDDPGDMELRVAFDFDGVLVDDQAESVFQEKGLKGFQELERRQAATPHAPGPLKRLLDELGRLQNIEMERSKQEPSYQQKIRVAIITSRNAPAHKRVVTTLREWGVAVDEVLFLGGMEKTRVLGVFRPHIFFDDQKIHTVPASGVAPAVHVPFGRLNQAVANGAEDDKSAG